MKITTFLILLCTLSVSASVLSQTVSLDLENVTIRQAFDEIETQTGFKFFYLDEQIDDTRRIDLVASNQTVEDIILQLFNREDIKYKVFENNLVVIAPTNAMEQQGTTISGSVVSGVNNMPLAGVNVLEKGTLNGTVTDKDGNYTITVENENAVLVFSYIGFLSEEYSISGQTSLNVTLIEDIASLEEVVVIGYGTQRKKDITSAIASLNSEDFVQGAVKDVGQLMQGKVAGLSVTNPYGNPTEKVQIMLRGSNTLRGEVSPLVVIDGMIGDLETIAPQDIESIDVLKDGSAAAIYGTKGTNGVILLTTKQGIKRGLSAEYRTYISTSHISKKPDFMDASDYRNTISSGIDTTLSDWGYSTDWLGEITQTPVSHMHSLNVSGGQENSQYNGTFTYNHDEGIFKYTGIDKFKGRMEMSQKLLNNMMTAHVGVLGGLSNDPNRWNNEVYRQANNRNPTLPITEDGTWHEQIGVFESKNPVAMLEERIGENKEQYVRFYGSVTINPITGLDFKVLGSSNHWKRNASYFETFKHYSTVVGGDNGFARKDIETSNDNQLDITANYAKLLGEHRMNVLIGYSYTDHMDEGYHMANQGFPTDYFTWNNMEEGAGLQNAQAEIASHKNSSKIIGAFARMGYSYKNKYLLNASIRREGSTRFGENYKWGNFPAIQAAWRISSETFMQNVSLVNDLKLRAGYGITGNDVYEPYRSLTLLEYSGVVLQYDENAGTFNWAQTLNPVRAANKDLRWEKKHEYNIGLDFTILNNRISGAFDYYKRNTKDLIWDYSIPVPPNVAPRVLANAAEIENKGFEIMAQVIPVQSEDFEWVSVVTFSQNISEILKVGEGDYKLDTNFWYTGWTGPPVSEGTHIVREGGAIGDFYTYKVVDIDEDGLLYIEEEDGDTIRYTYKSPLDRQIIGNGLPKQYASWNNTLRYKNLKLSVTIRGAFDFQVMNLQRMFYENSSQIYNKLRTAYDPVFKGQRLGNRQAQAQTDLYIEDADYIKIDNVTVGYDLNLKDTRYIKNIYLYGSILNLYTITNYSGVDPEVNRIGLEPGIDHRDAYPTIRTFTLGLNVKF